MFSRGKQSQALIHVLTLPSLRNSVYLILSQPVPLGIVEETHLEVTLEVERKLEVGMSKPVLIKSND
jgi:hypothetical protein